MKKMIIVILMAVMVLTLAGCKKNEVRELSMVNDGHGNIYYITNTYIDGELVSSEIDGLD